MGTGTPDESSLLKSSSLLDLSLNAQAAEDIMANPLLQSVFDQLPVCVIICSAPDGKLVLQNRAAAQMMGRLPADCTATEIEALCKLENVDGESGTAAACPLSQALEGHQLQDARYAMIMPDGSRRYAIFNSALLKSPDGSIFAAMVVYSDVTNQVLAEAGLRESEERYRAFIEQSSEAIWRCELDEPIEAELSEEELVTHLLEHGYLAECNDAMARMYGFESAHELIGLRLSETLTSVDPQNIENIRMFLREGFRLVDAETYEPDRHGNYRHFRNNMVGVVENGKLVRAWGTQRDITKRKVAETQLRESEDRYRDLVEHSNDLICTHDLNGTVLSVNRTASSMLGLEPEQAIGRNLAEAITPAFRSNFAEYLEEVRRKGIAKGLMSVDTRTGETRICEYEATLRTEGVSEPVVRGVSRDVTERTRAEWALRKSEQRFSKAFNASPNPMAIVRMSDAIVLDVNDAFLQTAGYSRSETIGKTASELRIWPEWPDKNDVRTMLINHGSIKDVESVFRTKHGKQLVMLMSAEAIDLGGEACVLAAGADITERKQAEVSLRESEAKLRVITAQIPGSFWTTDTQLHLLTAQGSSGSVSGDRDLEDHIGETLYQIYDAESDDHPAIAAHIKAVSGESALYEREAAGQVFEVRVEPLRDSDGTIIGCIGLSQNITERKRAEEEKLLLLARERKARNDAERERFQLNALLEQISEGLAVCDEKGSIKRANKQAQELLGFRLEELRELGIARIFGGRVSNKDGRPIIPEDLAVPTALRSQSTVTKNYWYARPDGKRLLLSVTASPFFDDHHRLVGTIALVRDVTEQQKQQDRAQQADKLRALGQLASGVAHNFNNALAAVLGYTQLSIPKAKGHDIEKNLKIVEQAAKDAARMVERIQNFARGSSSRDTFSALRIADIVRDAVDITRPRWRTDGELQGIHYDVRLEWKTDTELLIEGESSELREVFVNMILNALDAMPHGGSLTIQNSITEEGLLIAFTDTGTGMSEETRSRIFEPFFTTKGVKGLGMGLSESYRIIERHSGRIDVESQVGQGTTFRILLPLAQNFALASDNASDQESAHSARILIVDDEDFVRDVLTTVLQSWGHEVVKVSNADDAIEAADNQEFDLVFTDLAMPNTDGIATAQAIKLKRPDARVVLMSGYGIDTMEERIGGCTCIDATISKPFNLAEIRNTIRDLLTEVVPN